MVFKAILSYVCTVSDPQMSSLEIQYEYRDTFSSIMHYSLAFIIIDM